jgi:hypothetical protein
MLADDRAVLTVDDAIGIGLDLYPTADVCRQHQVLVVVEARGADLRHRGTHRVEAIERTAILNELAALFLEHFPDRALGLVASVGPRDASVDQPRPLLPDARRIYGVFRCPED